ncbi:MAG TPA: response regulator transcription factor [Mariprofundaceae bacterium]|nr:response regulator transcription factor [Mariprofundaceae bacterium]
MVAAPRMLLVDDDRVFCRVLAEALEGRGFAVATAHSVEEAMRVAGDDPPSYAVVDLSMPGASGLVLVRHLRETDARMRILVLTGYASIATAVEAIKLGATHYLAKPADTEEIIAALHQGEGDADTRIRQRPVSVRRLEWEHIQRVLAECDGNISAAARRLGMHRRTLQRKLAKRPVRG